MIRTYKTEAIILGRKNIGEADRLLFMFTRQFGKRTCIAKGIRRTTSRRAPVLEPFTHLQALLYRGRSLDIVTEATRLNGFDTLRLRLERVGFAYIALELTDRLTAENQEHETIFIKLCDFLSLLNDPDSSRSQAVSALIGYKQFLLAELGFSSDVEHNAEKLDELIESILESRLRSPHLLTNIQRHVYLEVPAMTSRA